MGRRRVTTLATFDSAPYDVVFKLMLHLTDFYALMLNDFIIKSNCRRRRRRGSLWAGSGGRQLSAAGVV